MDLARVENFAGQVINEMGSSMTIAMAHIGSELGLYKAMAGAGPLTPAELAERTSTHERYIREWLNNQAAGGYVTYDSSAGTYTLPDEHAMVLANPDSPAFMAGGLRVSGAVWMSEDKLADAFRTGKGIGWHEHHKHVHFGTEYFFRTGYRANLTTNWIPALEGVEAKLKKGAAVADVGCGHGASTLIMAAAYPSSAFWGSDYHQQSIDTARERAWEAGLAHRVTFECASAKTYPPRSYDLICFMDCLHDLGDPLGAAKHARESLAEDGTVLLVEPFAGDTVKENLNPLGRLFYAASTAFCTPNSLSQEVGAGLGAQAGEGTLRELFLDAGFTRFRRATQTPFNLILEARP
jgi:SAM-dependent methyltransferase